LGSLAIGVFCGSRDGRSPRTPTIAREVGELIAARGHSLVYGGGGVGIMGAVANGAADKGAKITGIIPHFLFERERGDNPPTQEVVLTDDLFARKREMFARSDAILALPGGFGTLDEVLEAVSLSYLNVRTRPIVLLDVDNFWAALASVLAEVTAREFATPTQRPLFQVTDDPTVAFDMLENV
jgi:uncharacterized protein (TIGR00730 family)